MEADLCQRRGEKIRASETPNDFASGSGGNPGGKQRCGRSVDSSSSTTGEFVDCAICQSAARKPLIDLGNTKWQDRFRAGHRAFEMLNAVSKIGNDRVRGRLRHSEPSQNQVLISLEASTFSICSFNKCESMYISWRVLRELQPFHMLLRWKDEWIQSCSGERSTAAEKSSIRKNSCGELIWQTGPGEAGQTVRRKRHLFSFGEDWRSLAAT